MKKFLIKIARFSSIILIPLIVLITLYIILDPFKVLQNYNSFYEINQTKGNVGLNRGFVSTSTLINNSKRTNYNSFILGNSRSLFYQVSDWKTFLPMDSKCFHYDASAESLWALEKKIEYIDQKGIEIKNILLVLDHSTLIQDKSNKPGHLFIIPPALVDNSNLINFHKTFFSAFVSPTFFYAYLDYNITGKLKPYMKKGGILEDELINYDVETNEIRSDNFEKLIKDNKYYTKERLSVFYPRDTSVQQYSKKSILKNQKELFEKIQLITKKNKTLVKVVISPLYDQLKLNKDDLDYLNALFGKNNVFDFSGINKYTNDYKNYYENSHYRPQLTKELLKIIYK